MDIDDLYDRLANLRGDIEHFKEAIIEEYPDYLQPNLAEWVRYAYSIVNRYAYSYHSDPNLDSDEKILRGVLRIIRFLDNKDADKKTLIASLDIMDYVIANIMKRLESIIDHHG